MPQATLLFANIKQHIDPQLTALYAQHVATRTQQKAEKILAETHHSHLIIPSGTVDYYFLDDQHGPFVANPHFKAWLPLLEHPDCWLCITPGEKPLLIYYQPQDYWHVPPADPQGFWVKHFNIQIIRNPQDARALLPQQLEHAAIIGATNSNIKNCSVNNPLPVIHRLHLDRTRKTPYELACMRFASQRATYGHNAAAKMFAQSQSEYAIHLAYCQATLHNESQLPYGNIIALNEHSAILHYQYQDRTLPDAHRSFLIDAGAQIYGYAADITRTYHNQDADFQALWTALETAQLKLCQLARPGQSYPEIHLQAHQEIAQILATQEIVQLSPEAIVDQQISSYFFPHGVGHYLGLQVHDVAGFLKDASGTEIPKPQGHPYLRLTRTLEAGNVLTIEPGIYFIDLLLNELQNTPHQKYINWSKVKHLKIFGGIRIEDNIHVTKSAPENLTRDAFQKVMPT